MGKIRRITVRTPSKRYDVFCGRGVLRQAARRIAALGPNTGLYLLMPPKVRAHWTKPEHKALGKNAIKSVIVFDDSESKKNLSTVENLCRDLARAGADRKSILVAVGGGVVGDVGGFVAASYLRGVRLVHIPTTLVAQVDSSIGGKTGVNLPEGKNLVGAFYQPDLVLAELHTLPSLPDKDFRSGLYEVIKYGVIGDKQLFVRLERNIDKLIQRDPPTIEFFIPRCIAAKVRITSQDEREAGIREILNFGHTFGHALESVTRYRVFRHGEAVGWGMIAGALLGVVCLALPLEDAARIIRLVRRVGPLPRLPKVSARQMLDAMRSDKKTRAGQIRFVLPDRIGHVKIGIEVPNDLLSTTWSELSAMDIRR